METTHETPTETPEEETVTEPGHHRCCGARFLMAELVGTVGHVCTEVN